MKIEQQKRFYDDYWRERKAISFSKRNRIMEIMRRLSPLCKPSLFPKILDLGCGDGRSVSVWSLFGEPYGLELSPEAVKSANMVFPGFEILEGDATATPYKDNFFDVIINQEVIEHIENQTQLIIECKRILKHGGSLILTTPNKYYFDRRRGGNYSKQPIEKLLSPSELNKLLKEVGLKVISINSAIPIKGDYGIYFILDRVLTKFKIFNTVLKRVKNHFLFSAHLIVIAQKI